MLRQLSVGCSDSVSPVLVLPGVGVISSVAARVVGGTPTFQQLLSSACVASSFALFLSCPAVLCKKVGGDAAGMSVPSLCLCSLSFRSLTLWLERPCLQQPPQWLWQDVCLVRVSVAAFRETSAGR